MKTFLSIITVLCFMLNNAHGSQQLLTHEISSSIKQNTSELSQFHHHSVSRFEVSGVPISEGTSNLSSTNNNNNNNSTPTKSPVKKRKRRYLIFSRPTLRTANLTEPCSPSSEDFPPFFTHEQRLQGAVILAVIVGIYCFTLLAIICDSYFLPCVEKICEALNLTQDVAAATFMSVATSAPELFVNVIGTFVTESDIGIGTIVGSSLFNALGVASIGGLAAAKPIKLHWWPLTRDVVIYIIAITILVIITWDGVIYWYEGLVLFFIYFLYFTVMFQNARISRCVYKYLKKNNKVSDIPNQQHVAVSIVSAYGSYCEEPVRRFVETTTPKVKPQLNRTVSGLKLEINNNNKSNNNSAKDKCVPEEEVVNIENIEEKGTPFSLPSGSFWKKAFFVYTWPMRFVLFCTIPNPQTYPKLFPITFCMCIIWIGSNSYIVSWMISIIGSVFGIPDAVLGLTLLAAGGCLPEAISITIMSRRGEGSMGVSNSLGANTMNILLSLGMPWFLKTIMMGVDNSAYIVIDSGSIEYTILCLIPVALVLYLTIYFNGFRLSRTIGFVLIVVYFLCLILAILTEMVFFKQPACMKIS